MIGQPVTRATLSEVPQPGLGGVAAALGLGGGHALNFKFNPETLTRSKSASWTEPKNVEGAEPPPLQYIGHGSDSLSAKLLFDDTDGPGLDTLVSAATGGPKSVEDDTDQLFKWLTVVDENDKHQEPPVLEFAWGTGVTFTGILKQVSVQYLRFDTDGKPTRAVASIVMWALPSGPKSTNPTSGGLPGRTSTVVGEGDTLASISYRQYGDPNLWRAIALSNDIDDPARVPVGTRLLLPRNSDALALSAREASDG